MKPSIKIALAGLLSAAGALISALAAEFGGAAPTSPEDAATPTPEPEKKKPGRPAKEKPAEKATEEKPVAAEPEASSDEPVEGAKTYEELRALIEPLVKDGKGNDVKALIKKYDPDSGSPSIKTMPAKNHAAFERDIMALTY